MVSIVGLANPCGGATLFGVSERLRQLEGTLGSDGCLARTLVAVSTMYLGVLVSPALADVVISSAATSNMSCVSGVCTPTSQNAVLNVSSLETMLASGNLTIHGSAEPVDIDVQAAFSWSSGSSLTLDLYHSVNVGQPFGVTGNGGLSVVTNDGGSGGWLAFAPGANVEFSNLSSNLTINAASYALVGNIKTLASDIAANPSGAFALANDYNAAADGTYPSAPVATSFAGNFQGLGNVISNLKISTNATGAEVGLFGSTEGGSSLSNVVIQSAVVSSKKGSYAGILAGLAEGTLFGDHTSGAVSAGASSADGGLAGYGGTVVASSSSARVSAGATSFVGGLLGGGTTVAECFATGATTIKFKSLRNGAGAGGLVGGATSGSMISNSYATGKAEGEGDQSALGGLIASVGNATIASSYSTGNLGGNVEYKGGFFGLFETSTVSNSYWDTQTSGTPNASGNEGTIPGVSGVTTKQLKSALPAGFDPTVWAQSKSINNGFPYLIANPPQ